MVGNSRSMPTITGLDDDPELAALADQVEAVWNRELRARGVSPTDEQRRELYAQLWNQWSQETEETAARGEINPRMLSSAAFATIRRVGDSVDAQHANGSPDERRHHNARRAAEAAILESHALDEPRAEPDPLDNDPFMGPLERAVRDGAVE